MNSDQGVTRLKYRISYNEQRARCCCSVKIDLSHEEKLKFWRRGGVVQNCSGRCIGFVFSDSFLYCLILMMMIWCFLKWYKKMILLLIYICTAYSKCCIRGDPLAWSDSPDQLVCANVSPVLVCECSLYWFLWKEFLSTTSKTKLKFWQEAWRILSTYSCRRFWDEEIWDSIIR